MMRSLCCGLFAALAVTVLAQESFGPVEQIPANPDNEPAPVHPVPHPRQVKWMETEFYGFFHYGMNTFTNLEWGNGDEKESIYAPKGEPNPRQWLEACKAAGMKGGIAVVKHHDGFCLWPTETTTHNCTNGSGQWAATNIPEKFAEAARDLGMKYGFYISPWDRNSAQYGKDTYVREVFLRRLPNLPTMATTSSKCGSTALTAAPAIMVVKAVAAPLTPRPIMMFPTFRTLFTKCRPTAFSGV